MLLISYTLRASEEYSEIYYLVGVERACAAHHAGRQLTNDRRIIDGGHTQVTLTYEILS